jgi:TRAP-type C4-dicarboxylate transport system substrate-binding protein
MTATISRLAALATVALAGCALAACGSDHADKSGATNQPDITLRLAMPDGAEALGRTFVQAVERRSRGSVRLERDTREYSSVDPANELALAADLERGRADVGYLPARAWSAAGVGAFNALLAPFAITTDAAAQTLASSPVAEQLLAALPDEVVGLALVPSQTRRVLATRPPVDPAAYIGLRVRIVDNLQTAAGFTALGAAPVQGLHSDEVSAWLAERKLDAVESAPDAILNNNYTSYLHHLSGYGLFPKFQSIVLSRGAWERLTDDQRDAVRRAAEDTVDAAATAIPQLAASNLRQLCAADVRIAVPTNAQLRALASAAGPAIADLREDDSAAGMLDAIEALPGTGPQRLTAPLPDECTRAAKPVARTGPATIPEGTYVVRMTVAEFESIGATGDDFRRDVTFTMRFKDGRFIATQRPTYPDQCADKPSPSHPACTGTYEIRGDSLTFTWDESTPPPVPAPETVKWSYFNGELHFQAADVQDPISRAMYERPWRRVR